MIRTIRSEEMDQLLELTQAAFSVQFTETELKEKRAQTNSDDYLGYYIDDQLAAQLAILPMYIYVQGAKLEMGGIAQVASYPEMRRQGMVGKLLVASLERMKANGQTVSMLNPFSYDFYRKYGWDNFSQEKVFTFDLVAAPRYPAVEGIIKRVTDSDWRIVDSLYQAYARRYNGMLARSDNWWSRPGFKRKLGNLAVYYRADGEPAGYLLYNIKERLMRIHEWIYLDEEARRGLWQFALNHDSGVDCIKFIAPADDLFMFSMPEPMRLQQEVYPKFMIRIVDVHGFLGQYRFLPATSPSAVAEKLRVRLSDGHAEWNRGVWEIELNGEGSAVVTRVDDQGQEAMNCDIQTLSTMMVGCQRPEALFAVSRLNGSPTEISKWERALPRSIPYLMDLF